MIGVASRDDLDAMRRFVDDHELRHVRHVADESGAIWRKLAVQAQPTWLFVDDDGSVDRHFGVLDEDGLAAKMEALVSK